MAFVQQQPSGSSSGFGGGYQYGYTDGGNAGAHPFASPPPQAPPAASPPAPSAFSGNPSPGIFGGGGGAGQGSDGNGPSDMMWRMGINYGQSLLQQGIEQGEQGARKYVPYWARLRGFFTVDNQYVKRKLGILLFPFTRRFGTSPAGAMAGPGSPNSAYGRGDDQMFGSPTTTAAPGFSSPQVVATVLPTQDAFASDLYIPLMAMITYLLLSALFYGLDTQSPVTTTFLATTLTVVSIWIALEVIVGEAFAYFLRAIPGISLLDLTAISGYKYVLICLAVLLQRAVGIAGSTMLYMGTLVLYAAAAHVVFSVKLVRRENAKEDGHVPPRAKLLAYAIAATQIPGMVWMCLRPTVLKH